MVEPWIGPLEAGDPQAAWDLFIERYSRLIFAAIRHYTSDHDEVMDVFAQTCEALRADDAARLRRWLAQPDHRARFSTWLVTVVRNLTVDWFRHRDGRRRLSTIAADLPPVQRRIFELVFAEGRAHTEAYELLKGEQQPALAFGDYLRELRATYQAVAARRKGALMAELGGPPPEELDASSEDVLARTEQGARLEEVLQSLPPDERLAIQLFVVEELPAEQVARAVGLPNAKAVYNRVYRALDVLRARLERTGISGADL
jgi:RNA polymerase sigma factor (sigma-70 family)